MIKKRSATKRAAPEKTSAKRATKLVGTKKPVTAKPIATKPVATKSAATKPTALKSSAAKPLPKKFAKRRADPSSNNESSAPSASSSPPASPIPSTPPSAPPAPPSELEMQIGDLERELVRIIDEAKKKPATDDAAPPSEVAPDASALETARDLFSTDFYLRKWSRIGMRDRSEEVDDFGYDPTYEKKVGPFLRFLHDKYFRVESEGMGNVPREGRCLLVANHSGTVPFDGVMLKMALASQASQSGTSPPTPPGSSAGLRSAPQASPRQVRWLVEDLVFHFPFLGSVITRLGGVRACPENAERLLGSDALVAVFPEGNKGIGKLFRQRYQLQRFGRGGFIKLCLRTGTPMVPVAIVGGEETNPMLGRFELFAHALGIPYIPITPTFPWLGPAGLIPAPTKWKMIFGEPIDLSEHGPGSAEDDVLVGRLAERVRASIQAMLDKAVGERKGVFFA
jgi:1-acyl-sn-glycerol-3-phosphate acyltransferase